MADTPMAPEQFAANMRKLSAKYANDEEVLHARADELMCNLLRALGYGDGIVVYEDMPKWYA